MTPTDVQQMIQQLIEVGAIAALVLLAATALLIMRAGR